MTDCIEQTIQWLKKKVKRTDKTGPNISSVLIVDLLKDDLKPVETL